MANSQKLSELPSVNNILPTDLFLISRNSDQLSSHGISYDTISADLYSSIFIPLNDKIEALRSYLLGLLSGEPSLSAISSNAGNMVTDYPRKMVGISAIYDLANVVNNWKPLWQ